MGRTLKIILGAAVILALAWLTLSPVPFEPEPTPMAPSRAGTEPFINNNILSTAQSLDTGHGPEGVAFDAQGRLVTGLEDGRIVRRYADGTLETLGNTEGRPLGLEYDRQGRLIIADAFKGLLALNADGEISVLVNSFEGKPMLFVDDLAIGPDGRIWFSDASQLYPMGTEMDEIFDSRHTGRLFVYNPANQETSLVADNLSFANGVALDQAGQFVLVNETMMARITRVWIDGPKAGQRDIFIDGLPGFPDNITEAPNGDFWLSIVAPRSAMLDAIVSSAFLRKLGWRLSQVINPPLSKHVWAVRLGPDGEVKQVLDDNTGFMMMMTSVLEHENTLYLGSLAHNSVRYIPLAE